MSLSARTFVVACATVVAAGCSRNASDYVKRGDAYAAKKQIKEAIVEYRNAIQKDEKLGEVRLKLADLYAEQGDGQNAFREYIRASDLLPNNRDAQLKGGSMLLMANRYAEAKTRAENILKQSPRDSGALMLLGNALAGMKDLDAAVRHMNEAIESDPGSSLAYSNLGSLRLARGEQRLAEASFKKAILADPNSVAARVALANFYRAQNRDPEAETVLSEAVRMEPANVAANSNLVELYIRVGRPEEAEAPLKRIVDVMHNADAQFALAQYYMRMKRNSDAVPVLRRLAEEKTTARLARSQLAAIDYKEGRLASAYAELDGVLKESPNYAPALLLKGQLLSTERKFDEAMKFLKAAAAADPPREAEPMLVMARIYLAKQQIEDAQDTYKRVLGRNPTSVPAQLGLAQLYAAKGQVKQAAEMAKGAVTSDPRNAEARFILVRVLQAAGDAEGAERELRILQERMPPTAALEVQLGALFLSRNNPSAARAAFSKALDLGPGSPEALAGLIGLDLNANNRPAALQRLESRLKESPNDKDLWYLAAHTYFSVRDFTMAEKALKRTIELDPSNLNAFAMLGGVYASQHRLDDARVQFDAWAAKEPRSVAAHTMIAMLLEKQNRSDDAKKTYEKILEIDPHAAIAANNLAYRYATQDGNLDMAMQLAKTATAQVPNEPDFIDTLGWVYVRQNAAYQAVPLFQQAISRQPKNAQFHYHLGMAYSQLGEDSKAIAELKLALSLNTDFDGVDDARKALKDLTIQ